MLPLVAAAVIVLLVCCASYVLTYPDPILVLGRLARSASSMPFTCIRGQRGPAKVSEALLWNALPLLMWREQRKHR